VPTRTGSRFAAPRFRARFDCRQRRAVADAVAEPEPRTAHSPPSSRPQSVSNMRPFSDPPKRDKDCVATCPASRTQHRQRVFTASEERLSAVGPRPSPASPTRPQSTTPSPGTPRRYDHQTAHHRPDSSTQQHDPPFPGKIKINLEVHLHYCAIPVPRTHPLQVRR